MISLQEYTSREVDLPPEDLSHLLGMVRGESDTDDARVIESITPTSTADVYRVKPGAFVGRLGLPSGRTLDIASRFDLGEVVEMLRFSGRLPIRLDQLAPAMDREVFILDVIALAFAREIDRLISFGLAKGYRPFRFDRPPYPGRPDLKVHLGRYAARPDKLVTEARRITIDIELNRALAAATEVLTRVSLQRQPTRALMSVYPAFGRVKKVPTPANAVSKIPLNRLTTRYRDGLALAELILRGQSLAPEGDPTAGASILFNMPKVWEACVAKWTASCWPNHDVVEQHSFNVTSDGSLSASADVTVWDSGRLVALYDAKYKSPGQSPTMSDVYQMVTYCTRLGIDQATLVYPVKAEPKSYLVGDVVVRIIGLDVRNLVSEQPPMKSIGA